MIIDKEKKCCLMTGSWDIPMWRSWGAEEEQTEKRKKSSGVECLRSPVNKVFQEYINVPNHSIQICILKWQWDTILTIRPGRNLKTDTAWCQKCSEVVVPISTIIGKTTGLDLQESNLTLHERNFCSLCTYIHHVLF